MVSLSSFGFSAWLFVKWYQYRNSRRSELIERLRNFLGPGPGGALAGHLERKGLFDDPEGIKEELNGVLGAVAGSTIARKILRKKPFVPCLGVLLLLFIYSFLNLVPEFAIYFSPVFTDLVILAMAGLLSWFLMIIGRGVARPLGVESHLIVYLPLIIGAIGIILEGLGRFQAGSLLQRPGALFIIGSGIFVVVVPILVNRRVKELSGERRISLVLIGASASLLIGLHPLNYSLNQFGSSRYGDLIYFLSGLAALLVTISLGLYVLKSGILKSFKEIEIGSRRVDGKYMGLKEEGIYSFNEDERMLKIFGELVKSGVPGLCITRRNPDGIRNELDADNVRYVWLSNEDGMDEALGSSNVGIVSDLTKSFLDETSRGIVFLDGLEYLVLNNGFERTMNSLYDIRDNVVQNESRLLLVVPRNCFKERQLAFLERETRELPKDL